MFANRVSRHRTSTKRAPVADAQKIHVESVNHPGRVRSVDAEMYQAMKAAFLVEIEKRLLARLPRTLFPEGAKAGWWAKTVQLDLEAKGILSREETKPLRLPKA